MRPRGDVRQALSRAAMELAAERGAVHWRAIAARAQVGFEAARQPIKDMRRAGELQPIGSAREPWSRRPLTTYVPSAVPTGDAGRGAAVDPTRQLAMALRTWR